MTLKERANRILARAENDFFAAQRRRDEIETALGMLANSGISDELLNPIDNEWEAAREDVLDASLARLMFRTAMRERGWLDD